MSQDINQTNLLESSASYVIDELTVNVVAYVMFTSLCQTINIVGIVTNIINLVCFVKQGFSDTTTVSLLGLSVADLGNLITMIWMCICFTPAFIDADLPFDTTDLAYLVSAIPHFAFPRVSSSITAFISLERCLSIVAPLKVKQIITPKRAGVITVSIFFIFTISASPSLIVNSLGMKISVVKNRSIVGMVSTDQREEVEMVAFAVNNFVIPVSAFAIVAICTVILSIRLRSNAKWRMTVSSDNKIDRISSRNLKVAKMVVAISTLFIVCLFPNSMLLLVAAFVPELWVTGKYVSLSVVVGSVTFVLECINSSVNILIYHRMSQKYRDTFRSIFMK